MNSSMIATGRSFCLPHVFKTEHWGGHFAEVRRDPIRPRRIELEPRDARHDIDATRRQTYRIDDLRFDKIADLHLYQRSTKALQCPPGSAGILLRGAKPEIDVEGGSHVDVSTPVGDDPFEDYSGSRMKRTVTRRQRKARSMALP